MNASALVFFPRGLLFGSIGVFAFTGVISLKVILGTTWYDLKSAAGISIQWALGLRHVHMRERMLVDMQYYILLASGMSESIITVLFPVSIEQGLREDIDGCRPLVMFQSCRLNSVDPQPGLSPQTWIYLRTSETLKN